MKKLFNNWFYISFGLGTILALVLMTALILFGIVAIKYLWNILF